ncbi:hypothetical protein ES332_D11G392100v1 [Gossypium tomentosum]|uniref:Uncharacterized protein n=1 Tax=Gossypium tomentosum TaxID=34277 RepID=A0A5D2IXU2_GOSTO|nr:hypothetical protein ES332_D11G392100v1 [Gossypium tomentosum]
MGHHRSATAPATESEKVVMVVVGWQRAGGRGVAAAAASGLGARVSVRCLGFGFWAEVLGCSVWACNWVKMEFGPVVECNWIVN